MRKPFLIEYTMWHFGQGTGEIVTLWKNLLWFGYHFFSIPLMLKTLFRPIYRMHAASEGGGLNIGNIFENIVANTIARLVGLFLRVIMIMLGSFVELVFVVLGPFLLVSWLILPVIPVLLLISGVNLIL